MEDPRVLTEQDSLSAEAIIKALGEKASLFPLEYCQEISSTNTELKKKADDLPAWYTLVADRQTAGRGRIGRDFFSPGGTGLYMSLLLPPVENADAAGRITTTAAVAVCRAIEECTGERSEIKWVNDVFVRGKKVCGILTEAASKPEKGGLCRVVLGIGMNVYEPENGFPAELAETAGAVCEQKRPGLRAQMAAAILLRFSALYAECSAAETAGEYRERSMLLHRDVLVLRGEEPLPAHVLDVDETCRLVVQYADGSREALSCGEVSVRAV